jgi:hypothetical protein|tara:strand:- start:1926 stop:3527 length:1602 start_codon:yes stop_codon:yes gene_type:complete
MAVGLPKYKSQVQVSGKGTAQSIDPSLAIKAAGAGDALLGEIVENAGGIASDFLDKKSKLEEKARAVKLEDYTERWISEVDTEINNKLLEEGNTLSFEDIQKSVIDRKNKEYDEWVKINLPENEIVGREKPLLDSIQNKAKRTVDIKSASNIAKRKAEKSVLDISNRYLSLETELYNLEKTNSELFNIAQIAVKIQNNTATNEERKQFEDLPIDPSNLPVELLAPFEKIKQKEELGLILDRTMDPLKRRNLDINARKTRFKTQLEYEVDQFNLGKIATVEDLAEKVQPILDEIKNDNLLNQGEKDAITYNVNEELRDVEIKEIRTENAELKLLVKPKKDTITSVAFGLGTKLDTRQKLITSAQLAIQQSSETGQTSATDVLNIINQLNTGELDFDDALRKLGNSVDDIDLYNRGVTLLINELDSLSNGELIKLEGFGFKNKTIKITEASSPIVKHLKLIGYRVAALSPTSKDAPRDASEKAAELGIKELGKALDAKGVTNADGSINADRLDEEMNKFYEDNTYDVAKQIYNQG